MVTDKEYQVQGKCVILERVFHRVLLVCLEETRNMW